MKFIADLHVHSRYSRGCSRELTPENLWQWGQLKGLNVLGTGDFTHPVWLAELESKLEPAANGLLALREEYRCAEVPPSCRSELYFLPSAEISCIYRKHERTRKVHLIIFAPDLACAARINRELARIGNLSADGRPILGLDAKRALEIVLAASPDAMLVPAHAWTPHFSIFGAASGFDSLAECFEELAPHIYAIETGLSSDPRMNRRISNLDRLTLISNSDAHSLAKLGREANLFDTELSYQGIITAIRTGKGFSGTIEFFPEEGKYYADGHRNCGIRFTPSEYGKHTGLCPVCGRKLTMGVQHRVNDLADRAEEGLPGMPPFYSTIPLQELIAQVIGVGVASKKVKTMYFDLLERLGPELEILLTIPATQIGQVAPPRLAEAIALMRSGKVIIEPGYDGAFGIVRIYN